MSLISCKKCGKEYSTLAGNCPSCGEATPQIKEINVPEKKNKRLSKGVKLAVLILCLITALTFLSVQVYSNSNYDKGNDAMQKGDFESAIIYYDKVIWNQKAKERIEQCNVGLMIEKEIAILDKEIAEIIEREEMERALFLTDPDALDMWQRLKIRYGMTDSEMSKNRRGILLTQLEKLKNNEKVQYNKNFYMPL